jgi:hypothetical protein
VSGERQPLLFEEEPQPDKPVIVTHQPCQGSCGNGNRCDDFIYRNGYCKNPKLRAATNG